MTAQERADKIYSRLYPFQRIGVKFLDSHPNSLLGDDMGLGKTVQALAWMYIRQDIRPATVVCPANVKFVWERMAAEWCPDDKVSVITGREPDHSQLDADIRIINYAILPYWQEMLRGKSRIIIADECHYLGNRKTQRTKTFLKVARGASHKIFMSGTPITGRPVQFFTTLNQIDPINFGSFWKYVQRYCNAKHTRWGWDFDGASHLDELHGLIHNRVMLRRLKTKVLDQLPAKRRCVVPLPLENMIMYKAAERNFTQWMSRQGSEDLTITNPGVRAKTEALKQIVLKQKLPHCISWIEDFLSTGEKLIVFASHTYTIETLLKHFGKIAVSLYGKTKPNERKKSIDSFINNAKTRLFLGNIQAAGTGIDGLQHAASNVAFLELSWSPGQHVQAEDRCYRIGQENEVMCYYLIAHNTIEEEIMNLLDKKRKVLEQTLDGGVNNDEEFWTDLLSKYRFEKG